MGVGAFVIGLSQISSFLSLIESTSPFKVLETLCSLLKSKVKCVKLHSCISSEVERSSDNTMAYHTCDPGSIPDRGGSSKNMRVSEVNLNRPLPSSMPDTGIYQEGLVETCEISVCTLFPVISDNKELVEVKTWTSRTITHPPAFTTHSCTSGRSQLKSHAIHP